MSSWGAKRKDRLAQTARKHDTDSGMTEAQRKTVLALGDRVQGRGTEKGYIVGADGRIQDESLRGNSDSAAFKLNPCRD